MNDSKKNNEFYASPVNIFISYPPMGSENVKSLRYNTALAAR